MATQPRGPRGCLFIGSVSSCATAPEPLREKVVAAVRASTDRLQQALERNPEIARREDVRALARFFAAEGHGLAVLARAGVRRRAGGRGGGCAEGPRAPALTAPARPGTCTQTSLAPVRPGV